MFKIKVTHYSIEEVEKLFDIIDVSSKYKYVIVDDPINCDCRFINIVFNDENIEEMKTLIKALKETTNFFIVLKGKDGLTRVNIKKIDYFEYHESEVIAHVGKEKYFLSEKLSVIENQLKDKHFIRISKQILINITNIIGVLPLSNYRLVLTTKNNIQLEVNRAYTKEVKTALSEYKRDLRI